MIKATNISKSYDRLDALINVSFALEQGEVIGLLGANGAGKSTLMKILSGILLPDSGILEIFNKTFHREPIEVKKLIGYLSEDNPLYDEMYVKEYLDYVANIYQVEKSVVSLVLEKVDLKNEQHKKIAELSKGNRQRVGIAQAIIHNPRFLILDEAASGLDPNQRESLNRLIVDLSKDKVILLSTHILSDVKEMCSRFILMNNGRIVADKSVEEVDSVENIFFELTNENSSR